MIAGAGPYKVMPREEIRNDRFAARAVEPEHIQLIRRWRNEQIDVLRQSRPITAEEQVAYFDRCIWRDKLSPTPSNILLIYLQDGTPIGYGGLVHLFWDYGRAELSFLLATEIEKDPVLSIEHFIRWLRLMKQFAFDDLGLHRITTETYAFRTAHIAALENNGFVREGRLREHVCIAGQRVDALLHGCIAAPGLRAETI